ncbi:hypothetical protein [Actinocorallia populi]|uniref:hypothetical protein n=1 Tax=Actinocorallia populi TaxID=2079200 RepID=UPI000D08C8DF|nr:hypothetical protein [Actinocorallia populi]
MAWAMVSVVLGFVGLGALSYAAFRVFLGARGLGRELERTRRRLEPRQRELRRRVDGLRSRAGNR